MQKRFLLFGSIAIFSLVLTSAAQQVANIDARMSGSSGGSGKCTFEVAVQGSAEVQIRGTQGRLVTLSGSPAQWRRLDCNQALPYNPTNFQFKGVDGHGRQTLASDPNSNGGVAVIRIDNNSNNNEGYTGDVTWTGGSSNSSLNGGNGQWGQDSGWQGGWNNPNSNNFGGQSQAIHAKVSGGGGDGRCTFEVAVNGVAEVQIRGDQGRLRTISGSPATWRRLDCNQPLPVNPGSFKFNGVDGHGSQTLVQAPTANNGVAVIRIDNGNRGNNEGYTGDITWKGGSGYSTSGWNNGPNSTYQWGDSNPGSNSTWNSGGWNGDSNWNSGVPSAAAQACQDYIARRVSREHTEVTGVQMLPDTVSVQNRGNLLRVTGQGQYQNSGGGTGGFEYRCTYDPQTGQVTDTAYRQ